MADPCPLCLAGTASDVPVHIVAYALGTHGHTLVVPARHVASLLDLSFTEREALWAAVDTARHRLDLELDPRPDGYTVRFELGPSAPNPHAHVHVVPRGWSNLATGERRRLLDGPENPLGPDLVRDLGSAHRVDIAVAFVFPAGVDRIYSRLADCLDRGGRVRVVTGDYGDASEPAALRRLLDLKDISADRTTLRIFETRNSGTFHPKAYIISSGDDDRPALAYVGSSNLSAAALVEGVEWNVRVTDSSGLAQTAHAFDTLLTHPAVRELDHAWVDAYAARRQLRDRPPPLAADPPEPPRASPQPHAIQREALAALDATRAAGNRAGLVVLATGLGKTWLSAFDSASSPRVLFVAHREEILRQALGTFRVLRPTDRLGLLTGDVKDRDASVLFASVSTLSRPNQLAAFAPDAFDYIVIDEFHHASASTYLRLIRYFQPKFLLGLTATPDRTDGGDLLALCDENLVYRCDVAAGIRHELLAPFHYFGVPDSVDYANIPWRSARFDEAALTQAVATQARAANALEQWRKRGAGRTLGFCVSQAHADFMAQYFRAAGLRAQAVHSGPRSAPRSESLDQLERGELDVLFAVDMFNEGLDIRRVDTVLMLRPTESKILWLQQIGRGLRRSAEKTHLRIIDYIGNHKVFLNKPAALLGMFGLELPPREMVAALRGRNFQLPPGCDVTYELESLEILDRLSPPTPSGDALREWYQDFAERTGTRPSALQAYKNGFNPAAKNLPGGSWLAFVESAGGLTSDQIEARKAAKDFLSALERATPSQGFTMLLLEALLRLNAIPGSIGLEALATELSRVAARSAIYAQELPATPAALQSFLSRGPLEQLTQLGGPNRSVWFGYDSTSLRTTVALKAPKPDSLRELITEIVQWQLDRYLDERYSGVQLRVLRNSNENPILSLDRKRNRLPEGWTDVEIDGTNYRVNFVSQFVNVVRPKDADVNVLPKILTKWFGPEAGAPSTRQRVIHDRTTSGGYRWASGAQSEGWPIVTDDGKTLDARYIVEEHGGVATIVVMSRGGERNNEYNEGLLTLLERLARRKLSIDRIAVDSQELRSTALDARTLSIDGLPYPIDLAGTPNLGELRGKIGRATAKVGRAPGATGSGNATKKIRIWVSGVRDVHTLDAVVERS